jgi:L-threonylcarbamoyladenylate synthase
VALALLFELQLPLVGPSANLSGAVSPTTAEHVRESFGDEVFVLDGGACRAGIESTVLSMVGGEARVLRPGLVSARAIAEVLGREVVVGGEVSSGRALASPGLLARHYAPRTPSRLMELDAILEEMRMAPRLSRVIVSHSLGGAANVVELPPDAEGYARGLYAALREADARGVEAILIERPRFVGSAWEAIRDRLGRATVE